MCGIVVQANLGLKSHTPVNSDVRAQFFKQSGRGRQGFGLFDLQHMKLVRESKEEKILKWLSKKDSNFIMFHHRFPTSTINVAQAAHPFSTHDYFGDVQYIMVHNGIIRNADELWTQHQQLGIRYQSFLHDMTFNDSEALLWDLALTLEGKQLEMKARGDMAFVLVRKVKGKVTELIFGRNGRPLNIVHTIDTLKLSSEGEGTPIMSDTLYRWDFNTHLITMQPMVFKQWASVSTYPSTTKTLAKHDDFDSYDDWYKNKYGIKAEEKRFDAEEKWKNLRKQAGSLVLAGEKSLGNAIAESIKKRANEALSSTKVVEGTCIEISHDDVIDLDSINMKDYEPTSSEIQNMAMDYIIDASGCFEDAYKMLEDDYALLLERIKGRETFSDIRQQLLMESAMEFIMIDPEYENEQSISSMWQSLYQPLPLVA